MTNVFVVGSANVDLIARVPHLPAPGETLLCSESATRPGGKGANQAVAASRLGARTTIYAAVGDDAFGGRVRASLDDEGVCVDRVIQVAGVATGIAMIVVSDQGENSIVVAPGANHRLDVDTLRGLEDELTPGDVVVVQLEIPLATCVEAARLARRAGARVVLNAAPLPEPGDLCFADLLGTVDVLVVNEGEALALADQAPPVDGTGWGRLAGNLRKLGPSACVVTLGGDGAVAVDDSGVYAHPAYPVDVVDTTGAGDAFCGALAVGLARGEPLSTAMRRGCAAGALATSRLGAQTALPTVDELDRFLREVG
ncbi:MAG TPA: ribokinase [Micromonosporaceae bacterium]